MNRDLQRALDAAQTTLYHIELIQRLAEEVDKPVDPYGNPYGIIDYAVLLNAFITPLHQALQDIEQAAIKQQSK